MQSIGIDAFGVGLMMGSYVMLTLALDIPSGIIADNWSRKGLLMFSMLFLATCSLILGLSTHIWMYLAGYIFYALYLVCTSGTYHALTYDILHEQNRSKDYSKIMGRAYALFLCGAGVANIASGFLAQVSLNFPFWVSVIPALINVVLIATIVEPTFHKKERKERFLKELGATSKTIWRVAILRSLVIVSGALAVAEVFKQDFSQLYMLVFTNESTVLGLLWAAYAFAWALGSFLAHLLARSLHMLIIASFLLCIILALVQSPWGLVIFMVQAVLAASADNLIETHVQNATPSQVRASVLSVLSTLNRIIGLPTSFILGWLISRYDVFWALGFVACIAFFGLIYWLTHGRRHVKQVAPARVTEPYAQI